MADKVINAPVKLGSGTALMESFSGPTVVVSLNPGQSTPVEGDISGIIVYYSLIVNGYLNSLYIPKAFFSIWFYDTNNQGSLYVRYHEGRLESSSNSILPGRIRGYQVTY